MPHMTKKQVRALGLSSGGLDSILSALILKNQGVDVTWITFKTPFFSPDAAIQASKQNHVPLLVEDITDVYMKMLLNPPAGYAKNMNPCMDCHALMFAQAGRIMEEKGYDFLFSGEVAGQRPMSQNKNSMNYVARHSGYRAHILRALECKAFSGNPHGERGMGGPGTAVGYFRSFRKVQMDLALKMGITDYPTPAADVC